MTKLLIRLDSRKQTDLGLHKSQVPVKPSSESGSSLPTFPPPPHPSPPPEVEGYGSEGIGYHKIASESVYRHGRCGATLAETYLLAQAPL